VVAIDIDGTLGDHHGHVAQFAELWLGREVKYNPALGWPVGATKFQFNKALGIGKPTYRQIKLAYRQGGLKRSMPVYEGAHELVASIREMGVEVWICTSRPAYKLDTIEPDTKHWLRVNRITFDHMIFGDNKYHDLVKQVPHDKIVCVLDDLTEMVAQATRLRLPAMLIERPHNADRPWLSVTHGELTAGSLDDARLKIERMVDDARS
jgi:hypothetical protein